MSLDLKAFLRIRKQFQLKQGILYRKTQVNDKARLQLVLPLAYRPQAMAGCHDQVGHLGQDRVLELLRDRFRDGQGCTWMLHPTLTAAQDVLEENTTRYSPSTQHRSYPTFRTYTSRLPSNRTQQGKYRKCIDCYRPFYKICTSLSL